MVQQLVRKIYSLFGYSEFTSAALPIQLKKNQKNMKEFQKKNCREEAARKGTHDGITKSLQINWLLCCLKAFFFCFW